MFTRRLERLTYGLLWIGLACGVLGLLFDVRLALLPAACAFGWAQIGGL
jgi:hypothetical protein